jgi:hypothetical protein
VVIVVFPVIDVEEVESLEDLISDLFIAGKEQMIGIDPCGIFVEITCADCGITLYQIILGSCNKA